MRMPVTMMRVGVSVMIVVIIVVRMTVYVGMMVHHGLGWPIQTVDLRTWIRPWRP